VIWAIVGRRALGVPEFAAVVEGKKELADLGPRVVVVRSMLKGES
jgi:hypothetical protein